MEYATFKVYLKKSFNYRFKKDRINLIIIFFLIVVATFVLDFAVLLFFIPLLSFETIQLAGDVDLKETKSKLSDKIKFSSLYLSILIFFTYFIYLVYSLILQNNIYFDILPISIAILKAFILNFIGISLIGKTKLMNCIITIFLLALGIGVALIATDIYNISQYRLDFLPMFGL